MNNIIQFPRIAPTGAIVQSPPDLARALEIASVQFAEWRDVIVKIQSGQAEWCGPGDYPDEPHIVLCGDVIPISSVARMARALTLPATPLLVAVFNLIIAAGSGEDLCHEETTYGQLAETLATLLTHLPPKPAGGAHEFR